MKLISRDDIPAVESGPLHACERPLHACERGITAANENKSE